jgi:hypothetical protein
MANVSTLDELRDAVKAAEAEIVVSDEMLARKVLLWNTLRTIANVAVIVILAIGIFAWADPLGLPLLKEPWAQMARRIVLAVGVLLLFAEYALPVVRLYKPAGSDALGLKLVPRKK